MRRLPSRTKEVNLYVNNYHLRQVGIRYRESLLAYEIWVLGQVEGLRRNKALYLSI